MGIGNSLKRALIDPVEWELCGSSVSVALKVPLVGVRRRRTCMVVVYSPVLVVAVITLAVLGTSSFHQMVAVQKAGQTLVNALNKV